MLFEEDQIKLAKQAYHAYGSVTDFKNYQGLPMPEWEALTDKIREAWVAASLSAYNDGFEDGKNITKGSL